MTISEIISTTSEIMITLAFGHWLGQDFRAWLRGRRQIREHRAWMEKQVITGNAQLAAQQGDKLLPTHGLGRLP